MYFSVETLRTMARGYYAPDEGVELRSYHPGIEFPSADAALKPGGMITLRHVGPATLKFHCHAWSGVVLIKDAAGIREFDLFSDASDVREVDLVADENGISSSVIICGVVTSNAASKGLQAWLLGVSFRERQPWSPKFQPLGENTDVIFGEAGTFIVPANDTVIGGVIKNRGIWAADDIAIFERYIGTGCVVIDVGANIGHHSVVFSKLVGPSGRVLAFEPQQFIYRYACANVAINGLQNVDIYQIGLGESPRHSKMMPIDYAAPANFGELGVSIKEDGPGEAINIDTLDNIIANNQHHIFRVDFIKIDVQSFELYVLLGAMNVIKTFLPVIFLEISPYWMDRRGYSYKHIYCLLKDVGYNFIHFADGCGMEDGVRLWSGKKSEEWDVLCVHPRATPRKYMDNGDN